MGSSARRALALALLLALAAAPAWALDWGAIVPGLSTMETVRARYGAPTRTESQKIEGFDGTRWFYEAAQAPTGLQRLIVDYGLKPATGFRPELVRSFLLEPKPRIFDRRIVVSGWGQPERIGKENGAEVYLYEEGLLVYFDKDGWNVRALMFTPPQPLPPAAPQR